MAQLLPRVVLLGLLASGCGDDTPITPGDDAPPASDAETTDPLDPTPIRIVAGTAGGPRAGLDVIVQGSDDRVISISTTGPNGEVEAQVPTAGATVTVIDRVEGRASTIIGAMPGDVLRFFPTDRPRTPRPITVRFPALTGGTFNVRTNCAEEADLTEVTRATLIACGDTGPVLVTATTRFETRYHLFASAQTPDEATLSVPAQSWTPQPLLAGTGRYRIQDVPPEVTASETSLSLIGPAGGFRVGYLAEPDTPGEVRAPLITPEASGFDLVARSTLHHPTGVFEVYARDARAAATGIELAGKLPAKITSASYAPSARTVTWSAAGGATATYTKVSLRAGSITWTLAVANASELVLPALPAAHALAVSDDTGRTLQLRVDSRGWTPASRAQVFDLATEGDDAPQTYYTVDSIRAFAPGA
ncbi:MAG: hypothetical protein SFX73_39840 [Kofleriaceae bacterium]|nr:hypothetical protein [Kofleriaceae bacterium]